MEDSEEYMLKWNSHNSEIISEFHQLAKEEMFTDVTLAVDNETFEAHKLVLSACSPYFKHLLTSNKCRHPVIFLKDVESHHIALLLQYMYLGQIAVKREELSTFLRSADHLKIRGLAMTSPTSALPSIPRRDVVLPLKDDDEDEQRKIIAAPSMNKGRKGYLPKKIRTSVDSQTNIIPGQFAQGQQSFSDSELPASPMSQRRNSGPLPTIMETFKNNNKDVDHMETLEMEALRLSSAANSTEEEEDQPVDFSQNSVGNVMRTSILSNYLKTGKLGHKQIQQIDQNMDEHEVASIGKADLKNLAAAWMEQTMAGLSQPEVDEAKKRKRSEGTLPETMGLSGADIADRLRAHMLSQNMLSNTTNSEFLSNLTPQTLEFFNQSSPNGKMANRPNNGQLNPAYGSNNGLQGDAGLNTPNNPSGKPSVECEICHKKLADPSSLYRHRKIHSGDKPHKCPYCTRRFIQRYNMKQHIKTHRMESAAFSEAEKAQYLPRPRQNGPDNNNRQAEAAH